MTHRFCFYSPSFRKYWRNDNTRKQGWNSACIHLVFLLNVSHRPRCQRRVCGKKKEREAVSSCCSVLPWEEQGQKDVLSKLLFLFSAYELLV